VSNNRTQDGLVQGFSSIRRSRHPGTTIAILDDADQQLAVEAQARLAQERSELARLEVGTRRELLNVRQNYVQPSEGREAQDNLRRNSG